MAGAIALFLTRRRTGYGRRLTAPDLLNKEGNVSIPQAQMSLPPGRGEAEESEQDAEARWSEVQLRKLSEAVDEIGRERVCYALHVSEQLLSKKLRGIEDKVCDARIERYCLKHQKSGRLAKWLLCDYAGYLPPRRPDLLTPAEAMREVVTLALAGEVGNAMKTKILELYERMGRQP